MDKHGFKDSKKKRSVESVVAPPASNEAVADGIRRIEDIATGCVKGLTEEEFRAALT